MRIVSFVNNLISLLKNESEESCDVLNLIVEIDDFFLIMVGLVVDLVLDFV